MFGRSGARLRVVLVAVVAGVFLVGCFAASTPSSLPMMGGSAGAMVGQPSATGSAMMGGGAGMPSAKPGYAYSRLSCSAPESLPGATVNVMLGDMGMTRMMSGLAPLGAHMMLRAAPAAVSGGQVSLVVSNMGWRTHELVILPLPAGVAAGERAVGPDGKVDETGSLGEVSNTCAEGVGEGIASGAVGWTTVTLAPGGYELVCNLQNHYANGMYQVFVVT